MYVAGLNRSAKQVAHVHVFFLLSGLLHLGGFYFLGLDLLLLGRSSDRGRAGGGVNFRHLEAEYQIAYPDSIERAAMFLKALPMMMGMVASMG